MPTTNMDQDNRVALAEIKGDIKLILVGQDRVAQDIKKINDDQNAHAVRIGILEGKEHQRAGSIHTVKLLWGGTGVVLAAAIAVAARHFGL